MEKPAVYLNADGKSVPVLHTGKSGIYVGEMVPVSYTHLSWLTVSGLSISLFIPDGFNWLDCHGAIGRCQSGKHS